MAPQNHNHSTDQRHVESKIGSLPKPEPFTILDSDVLSRSNGLKAINVSLRDPSKLLRYAKHQNIDAFAVAQGAWSIMLYAFTRITEPCFGCIGLEDHMSLIRVRLTRDKTVQDLFCWPEIEIHGSSPTVWKSVAFRNDLLINTLVVKRLRGHVKSRASGHEWISEEPTKHVLRTDVLLELAQNGTTFEFAVKYFDPHVSPKQAKTIANVFQWALEGLLETSFQHVATVEKVELIANDACIKLEAANLLQVNRCIHDLIEEQVATQPGNPAICAHDGSYTYAELSMASSKVGDLLVRLGAEPESKVAILLEKSVLYTVAILAVLKAGGAFIPLDAKHPTRRLEQLIREINPCVLISSSSLSETAHRLCSNVFIIDRLHHESFEDAGPVFRKLPTPNNAAYIIFTSGSTGKPKGVLVEHSAIATSALVRGRATGLGPNSRVLQYAAHTFDVSVDEIVTTLVLGGCICVPSEADRFKIAPAMERMEVNYALLTPTSARAIGPQEVPGLKTLLMGGELLSEDVNDKWSSHVRLFNVYGPTEASIACVMSERTGVKGAGNVIGQAIGSSCWVVDPEDYNKLMPLGCMGELVVGGPILARGYFNDPIKTQAAFIHSPSWIAGANPNIPHRFYLTGDLASLDDEGFITIYGRKDCEIKIRGHRINVEEVEHALLCSDYVQGVVVELPKSGPCQGKLTAILRSAASSHLAEPSSMSQTCYFDARGLDDDLLTLLHEHLRSLLPSTMIPSKWVMLPYLPETSSAKTDRKQIRTWLEDMDNDTHDRIFHGMRKGSNNVAQSHMESKLEKVWSKVLNIPSRNLRTDQSFIRNGGDSITAMEVRRLAKNEEVILNVSDILNASSLRELVACATSTAEPILLSFKDEAGVPFALSPVQRLYFDITPDGSDGFRQSLCVEVERSVTEEMMRNAIQVVVSRHPMLRARFARHLGNWMQTTINDVAGSYSFSNHKLSKEEDIERFAATHHPELCIRTGPLLHASWLEQSDAKQALHLSAHHLVIDLVSWRILLQDLEQILRNEPLPCSTLSFQAWCCMQVKYAATLDPRVVLPMPISPSNLAYWNAEDRVCQNTHGNATTTTFKLVASDTNRIMGRCNDAFGTQPVEIMLGAFYTAFYHTFSDRSTPTVFIESHGREPWHPSIDISRTVGWFTTAYPLHVPSDLTHDLHLAIKSTKQARRAIPGNGHPYFCCRYLNPQGQEEFNRDSSMEFVFNFAGQYQQLDQEDALLRRMSVIGEEEAHQNSARLSLFDISVTIEEGQLVFVFTYPKDVSHIARIGRLLHTYEAFLTLAALELPALVPENTSHEVSPLSSSHVCSADLAQLLIDRHINLSRDVEAVYPASALQQHMLRSQANEPWYYQVTGIWRIECSNGASEIDLDRIEKAWQRVVNRHSTLRTVFVFSPRDQRFISVVLRRVVAPVTRIAETDPANELERSAWCGDDGRCPPHHITLRRMKDTTVECKLEFSHVIIDATSRSIVLQELADAYEGKLSVTDGPQYQDYLEQVRAGTETDDSISITPCIFPNPVQTGCVVGKIASVPVHLRSPVDVFQVCSRHSVTISSLMFTVWSFLLSKYVVTDEVSFGYVVSNRAANVAGIERAVGLYINLLVCRVKLTPSSGTMDIAKQIQKDCADRISGHTRTVEATQHPENGRSTGLLNTMVNIRNSGSKSLHMSTRDLNFSLQSFKDPWNYDLALAVNHTGPGALSCTLDYRTSAVSGELVSRLARDLSLTFDAIVLDPNLTKQAWETLPGQQNIED